ncbi:hypothetical protein ACHAWX_002243 [Stephanocyclus meneghinianus]
MSTTAMHPLVRDLYKRAIIVGRDYPHPDGVEYVRRKWKEALRNPENCALIEGTSCDILSENERIIRKAVGRGRYVSDYFYHVISARFFFGLLRHSPGSCFVGRARNGRDHSTQKIQNNEATLRGGSGC